MKRLIVGSLLSTLILASCGKDDVIVEPLPSFPAVTTVSGTVHLGTQMDGTTTNAHTDADAAGKTLKVFVNSSAGDGTSTTTTVGSDLKYTVTLPTPKDTELTPLDFSMFDTCTFTKKFVTEGTRGSGANFTLEAHPDTPHYLMPALLVRSGANATGTTMGVSYVNQDSRVTIAGTCKSPDSKTTMTLDLDVTFKKGWNIVKQVTTRVANGDGTNTDTYTATNASGPVDLYATFQYHLAP
ncbi:hypothetical protein [Deinococcus ficus]|uniref:Lipoprotein n=1 Tax=Deinococcus ficus TaxID=317577 RepID=A0A221T2M1_9DEIO|nr:hypothetical protein [Deinococcus ficus]ASN83139.1 hypothetical protein DFI_18230 [Deinococcus ficus]